MRPLTSRYSALGILRISCLLLALSAPAFAERLQCADPLLAVTANDPATLELTCKVAAVARKELESCGVALDRAIEIEITEAIESDNECLGLYHCREDRIEILTPEALERQRDTTGPFAQISNQAYWESVIVHELAHAAYDVVPCPFLSCVATSEYVSYAMQVRSLPEDERALFGAGMNLTAKAARDRISAVFLFIAPDRFATYAWLHFQGRDDQCGYIETIMNGDYYFDIEPP